ncbi:DNA primase [Eubacteriales bacterium KG127]
MTTSYSHRSVENLKQQINIVDVIGNSIKLKKQGANYKACCPFHGEKTPSFVVSPEKQIFTCFGCGATGDAIEFVRKYYNLDFVEAIEKIAKDQGITLEKTRYDDSRDMFYQANKAAAKYFVRSLIAKPNPALKYLTEERKLTMETITKFGLGYADNNWTGLYNHMASLGYSDELLSQIGLISIKEGKKYDRFRNRVIFPIISTSGKVIGFGGRALDHSGAKYLNSPETPIFHKSNNLFSLNFARYFLRDKDYIIVVEGYMDAIGLFQSGIGNVTASLGTALTENHGKLLKRYAKKIILSYDSDDAGRNAAYKGVDILRNVGVDVSVLHVDDGKDPDEYVKINGKEGYLRLIDKSISGTDYQLRYLARGYNLLKDEEKIKYINEISKVFQKLSPVEQEVYAQKVGRSLGLDYKNILVQIRDSYSNNSIIEDNLLNSPVRKITPTEKILIKIIFLDTSYISRIKEYEGVFSSDLAQEIISLVEKEIRFGDGFIDEKLIKDSMDPLDAAKLDEILNNVPVGDIETTFVDCILNWKLGVLKEKKKMILDLLSIADAEERNQEGEKLQLKLMKIQQEIEKIRGGEVL